MELAHEPVGDGRRPPGMEERLRGGPELGFDAGRCQQRLDHALGLEEPCPLAGQHARHAGRLLRQLLRTGQEHVADLEHPDARNAHCQVVPGRVQKSREDERSHRGPLRAHGVLELDEIPARVVGRQPQPVGHARVPERDRRGLRKPRPAQDVDHQPPQHLVVAEPAAAGVAARQLCGHALDARDPHDLLDQVDLARGVGRAPGRNDPPAVVGLVAEPCQRPLDLLVGVLDADQGLQPLPAQPDHRLLGQRAVQVDRARARAGRP